MDRYIVAELRAANEACMTLMTLMALEDDHNEAAKLVAEDDRYAQRTTCMALAGFALSAVSALADQLEVSVEEIIQAAAQSAAMHGIELESMLDEQDNNDEGRS